MRSDDAPEPDPRSPDRGGKVIFEAVVTAMGVTVERNWPIVVR